MDAGNGFLVESRGSCVHAGNCFFGSQVAAAWTPETRSWGSHVAAALTPETVFWGSHVVAAWTPETDS